MSYGYDPAIAITALCDADARFARIIERIGAYRLHDRSTMTPFQALLQSIIYQQISGKAAGSIHKRVAALFPGRRPSAKRLLTISDEALRDAGLSRGKVASAQDLARCCLDRTVPTRTQLATMDDETIIEHLVQVRGIGRWTAEMLLIFNLGRPDVLPVTDLGVRKGFMYAFGGKQLPEPEKMLKRGERWRPYRSVASWYLWRASEL